MIYVFAVIPLADLLIKVPYKTTPKRFADSYLLILSSIYFALMLFGFIHLQDVYGHELIIKSLNLGLCSGVIAINIAHELGHRKEKFYQNIAKTLLLFTNYTHFFIEHNKGHHRFVATRQDPASSRKGESLYAFLPRTLIGSWFSALKIESHKPWWKNKTLHYFGYQVLFFIVLSLYSIQSAKVYAISSLMGILLLEVVNYIEHYGLERKPKGNGYERVDFIHSWDSSHFFSRIHIFNLSLHSDHHALATKPYYELVPHPEAHQMPTGYPGMMLLALIPPLWFRVMDKRL